MISSTIRSSLAPLKVSAPQGLVFGGVTVPDTLYKVTTSGTLDGTAEIFAYSQWVADDSGLGSVDDLALQMADGVASMLSQAIASSSPAATIGDLFPSNVGWDLVQAREWNPATNKQVGDPGSSTLVLAGGGLDSFALPNQSSLAVSMRTGTTGRRRWNRFYLPPFTITATGGGDHVALSVCQALSDWLVALNSALVANSPAYRLVKYSPAAGSFSNFDSTFIGTRLDTQRRRANAEPEVRVQDAFSYV